MKIPVRTFLLSIAAAGLAGCDSISYSQYAIRSASPADEKAVAQVVATAAREAGLKESTSESRVPKALAYYKESVDHFPVSLGARLVGPDVVVDLSCFHPGPPSSAPTAFKAADAVLSKDLPKAFGARLAVNPKPRIPFQNEKRPNQSPEPTAMSVTPPAAQESRQP